MPLPMPADQAPAGATPGMDPRMAKAMMLKKLMAARRRPGMGAPMPPAADMPPGGMAPGMKDGGSVSARADGCCQRGKTRGKFV